MDIVFGPGSRLIDLSNSFVPNIDQSRTVLNGRPNAGIATPTRGARGPRPRGPIGPNSLLSRVRGSISNMRAIPIPAPRPLSAAPRWFTARWGAQRIQIFCYLTLDSSLVSHFNLNDLNHARTPGFFQVNGREAMCLCTVANLGRPHVDVNSRLTRGSCQADHRIRLNGLNASTKHRRDHTSY